MTVDLSAERYADDAVHQIVPITENVHIARDTYRLRFHCPEMARRIVPGQFVMLRITGGDDPLLGRPMALYDTGYAAQRGEEKEEATAPHWVDVVFLVVGRLTRFLSQLASADSLEVWGPLGNGFGSEATHHLIMVAGGIGQTPFLALARESLGQRTYGCPPRYVERPERVTLCYGVDASERFAGVADFEALGVDVRLSTDDGSAGHHGLVTDLLAEELAAAYESCRVVCCGPEPMMEAVARQCADAGVRCDVSLETPMACGIGICFSCVAKVRQTNGEWDYKRTCVDGPVFNSEKILWH